MPQHCLTTPLPLCVAGVLLFQLASDTQPVTEDTRVMEIFISGDACISIYTHLCPGDNTRPMALDILWQVSACNSCDPRAFYAAVGLLQLPYTGLKNSDVIIDQCKGVARVLRIDNVVNGHTVDICQHLCLVLGATQVQSFGSKLESKPLES